MSVNLRPWKIGTVSKLKISLNMEEECWKFIIIPFLRHWKIFIQVIHLNIIAYRFVEHLWLPWNFQRIPKDFWKLLTNQRKFLEWMGENLYIKELEDWYRVSLQQISKIAPISGIKSTKGLASMLQNVYPDHKWNLEKLLSKGPIKASQRMLTLAIKKIFPKQGIL